MSNNIENEKSEDFFISPKLPPPKKIENSISKDISSLEIKKIPNALTQQLPAENFFFVEVLKNGTVLEKHFLNKNLILIGRSADCDIIFEHVSISRHHACLLWKENNLNDKDKNGFFYLTDLNSVHGTFLNKTKIDNNKLIKLQANKSFIKLGASSRLILFNCVDNDDSDEYKEHEDNFIKKITKIEEKDGCNWGLDLDYFGSNILENENESCLQTVLALINDNNLGSTENDHAYTSNPQVAIQSWFENEGYDFEYTIESENNKFKCSINVPIEDQFVIISGEEELNKKNAINNCCLRTCKILDKADLLFSWKKKTEVHKRKKDSDDELIDETGEKEIKKERLEALKKRKVENLETLSQNLEKINEDLKLVKNNLEELDKELNSNKTKTSDKNEDELENYMKNISASKFTISDLKIQKSKLKMKLSKLLKDKDRTERLIKIVKPVIKNEIKLKNTTKSNKINELISKAQAKLNNTITNQQLVTCTLKKTSVFSEEEEVSNIKKVETLNNSSVNVNQSDKDIDKADSKKQIKKEFSFINPTTTIKFNKTKTCLSKSTFENSDVFSDDLEKKNLPKLVKKKNLIKSNKELIPDDNYVEWLPPTDQSGDGRSKLNDKFGY